MVTLSSVQSLLTDLAEFEQMTPQRQAAFRARLTRYLNTVEGGELKGILEAIQAKIGQPERKRTAAKMTPETLAAELSGFAGLENNQRAAYKAKVQRTLNKAAEAGDTAAVSALTEIQTKVAEVEQAEAMREVRELAKKLLG